MHAFLHIHHFELYRYHVLRMRTESLVRVYHTRPTRIRVSEEIMATFSGFDPYKLTGIRVTDRELGHGSYATVIELEYLGLKFAGKKIHDLLLRQGDTS